MIVELTKFKLNLLWQVSSFACTKSHHIYCRNCSDSHSGGFMSIKLFTIVLT